MDQQMHRRVERQKAMVQRALKALRPLGSLASCITIADLTTELAELCLSVPTYRTLTAKMASQRATPSESSEFKDLIWHINQQQLTYIQVCDAKRRIASEQILTENGRKLLSSTIFSSDALLNEYCWLPRATAEQKLRNKRMVDFLLKVMEIKDERENAAACEELPFATTEEDTLPGVTPQLAEAVPVAHEENQGISGPQQQAAVVAPSATTTEQSQMSAPAQHAENKVILHDLAYGQELTSQQRAEMALLASTRHNQQVKFARRLAEARPILLSYHGPDMPLAQHGMQALPFSAGNQTHGMANIQPQPVIHTQISSQPQPAAAEPVLWEQHQPLLPAHHQSTMLNPFPAWANQEISLPQPLEGSSPLGTRLRQQHQQPSTSHQQGYLQTPFRPWTSNEGAPHPHKDSGATESDVSHLDDEMEPRPFLLWDLNEEMRELLLAFNDEWKAEDN